MKKGYKVCVKQRIHNKGFGANKDNHSVAKGSLVQITLWHHVPHFTITDRPTCKRHTVMGKRYRMSIYMTWYLFLVYWYQFSYDC